MNWIKDCRYFAPALVLAAAIACPVPAGAADAPQLDGEPLVTITSIVVNSIDIADGELVALATVTGDIVGNQFVQNTEIPLTLDNSECPILFLEVGPVQLDLLGLMVNLDDCEGGPIVVEVVAVSGEGNLLGNLLCALAGLLDQGLDLGEILDELGLTESELNEDLGDLTNRLNTLFEEILGAANLVSADHHNIVSSPGLTSSEHHNLCQGQGQGQVCDILFLEIGAIDLDLLGLVIETSDICLEITAQRGRGNLLGNLLCSLTGLLDGPANQNAIDALVRQIGRVVRQNL